MLEPASYTLSPCSYDDVRALCSALGISETLAWVLVRRGITEPAQARRLLASDAATDDTRFHDPMLLGDMAAAVERIQYAIAERQPIAVHGDYDADGVCSTTLLVESLEALGGDVRAFLPNRFENGYGLHLDTVERFAVDGIRLIIAVDCGITAVDAIAQAVDHGIDVIVCDHHQPGAELPPAIICSTRPGDYPFPDLCATAAAGKLAQALGAPYGDAQHELEAIATIADVVPLVGENRAIVQRGMRALRRTQRPGLRALLSACDLHARDVTERDIAFRVAPRINAVGRLSESERAYELLRAATVDEGQSAAELLHQTNDERKRIEQRIVAQAVEQIEAYDATMRAAKAYVVSRRDWHEGVVGIVAARLVERYHRPVVVISEREPLCRGSARSIPAYDLHAGLAACADVMVAWGGHTAAAGVTIEAEQIDALRRRLAAHADERLTERDLQAVERIDAVVAGDELSLGLAEELEKLAPFGHGNERPHLLVVGATVEEVRTVGADARHLKCTIRTGGTTASAIGFGHGETLPALTSGRRVDACVRVSVNRFRGTESLQLDITRLVAIPELGPSVPGMCATACDLSCGQRLPIAEVLSQAAEPNPAAGSSFDRLPALEPLLALDSTVDLRHANRSLAHVARLATAGHTQLVVCADVSRRRGLLVGPLHPERLGITAVALASERCSTAGIQARLRRVAESTGPRLVLADYAALEQCIASPVHFDAVVVLDPPILDQQRDALVAVAERVPLHLLFGAGEARFARDAMAAVVDARATLRGRWKQIKAGATSGTELERALYGDAAHIHTPAAVAHAFHELQSRNLVEVDGDCIRVVAAQPNGYAAVPLM